MSEVNAVLGLLQLKYVKERIIKRQKIDAHYRRELKKVRGIIIPRLSEHSTKNFSYFPILIGEDYPISRDELYSKLKENKILSRKYFYPLISDMPMYRGLTLSKDLPNARSISNKVLCLPIYSDLEEINQKKIRLYLR